MLNNTQWLILKIPIPHAMIQQPASQMWQMAKPLLMQRLEALLDEQIAAWCALHEVPKEEQ